MLSSEFGIFDWNTFSLSSLIITRPGIIFDLDLIYSLLPDLNLSILATLANLIHLVNLIYSGYSNFTTFITRGAGNFPSPLNPP